MTERGFSLLETLMVVFIMGILSAIALPYFYKWNQSARYKEAAWGIAAELRLGKQSALSTNLEHRVEFDLDARRHRLSRGNLPSGSTAWSGVNAWSALSNEVTWSSGAACDGTADLNVRFRPNGSSDAAVVCVKDTGNNVKYRVSVNATSGRAVIN